MDEPVFKQVSRGLFEETYYRLGGGESSGWTAYHSAHAAPNKRHAPNREWRCESMNKYD